MISCMQVIGYLSQKNTTYHLSTTFTAEIVCFDTPTPLFDAISKAATFHKSLATLSSFRESCPVRSQIRDCWIFYPSPLI